MKSLLQISDINWEWDYSIFLPEKSRTFFEWHLEKAGNYHEDYLYINSTQTAVYSQNAVEGTTNVIESILSGEETSVIVSATFARNHELETLCDTDIDRECEIKVEGMTIRWIKLELSSANSRVGSWASIEADLKNKGKLSLTIQAYDIINLSLMDSNEIDGLIYLKYTPPQ